MFSPEVDRINIDAGGTRKPTSTELERLESYGKGVLEIQDYKLANLQRGQSASFTWIEFKVTLTWPSEEEVDSDQKGPSSGENHGHK